MAKNDHDQSTPLQILQQFNSDLVSDPYPVICHKDSVLESSRLPIPKLALVPGSKSLSIRDLMIASLAKGTTTIQGWAYCDDVERLKTALVTLGVTIKEQESGGELVITGGNGRFPSTNDTDNADNKVTSINLGLSGTSARLLLAGCALRRSPTLVDGDAPLRSRPLTHLADALTQLGCIISADKAGYLPMMITPPSYISKLGFNKRKKEPQDKSINIDDTFDTMPNNMSICIPGDISSQFFSALLIIAPCLPGGLSVSSDGPLVSAPYIKLTIQEMNRFGVTVNTNELFNEFVIPAGTYESKEVVTVEADASGASYFFALATIHGKSITVPNLSGQSSQGDLGFLEVLKKLGSKVESRDNTLTVTGPANGVLNPLTSAVDFSLMPDVALTLMGIAPLIPGRTTLTGLSTLRIKECDRIQCPADELRKLGVTVEEGADWMSIDYAPHLLNRNEEDTPFYPTKTYHDHRMAMSFAVLGTKVHGISIATPSVVGKTFPTFWQELEKLREIH
jgi:3-phosphoshikimate 1-carboxyvinyltransferase